MRTATAAIVALCVFPASHVGLLSLTGCGTPPMKTEAWDRSILDVRPAPGDLVSFDSDGRGRIESSPAWMGGVDARAQLTFAGIRSPSSEISYAVVLDCDPEQDRLDLLPLAPGETPISVLASAPRRAELESALAGGGGGMQRTELSLRDAIADRRLGPPIPTPRRVYAVAANYPSHLEHDLAIEPTRANRDALAGSRARVFQKFPLAGAPTGVRKAGFVGFIGPFDDLEAPSHIHLPPEEPGGEPGLARAHIDYEVEIGVVIGRRLTPGAIETMSDEEIVSAIAGRVLISDAKSRNPQMFLKMRDIDRESSHDDPYATGVDYIDSSLGVWDDVTCRWWSYAAGWGSMSSAGPFFVAIDPDAPPTSQAILAARSYAGEATRDHPPPRGAVTGALLLRQCSRMTLDQAHADAMIWDVAQIVRSILASDRNALAFAGQAPLLEPGDVICLGTPGGTVITSKSTRIIEPMERMMFFMGPRDWHDAFFGKAAGGYLQEGDELLLWGEGLGYQHQRVRRVGTDD